MYQFKDHFNHEKVDNETDFYETKAILLNTVLKLNETTNRTGKKGIRTDTCPAWVSFCHVRLGKKSDQFFHNFEMSIHSPT